MAWSQRIEQALVKRRLDGQYRQRHPTGQADGRTLSVAGHNYLNFSANDYLGLSHDGRVVRAWQQGAERYGVGAGGSAHVTGYRAPQAELEHQLADWLGYRRALLFISGFAANQAVIAAMMAKNDRIFADKLCHASLLEAASLSPATLRRFGHNQPSALAKLLAAEGEGETLVVTEGIFSMDGDRAALKPIHQLARDRDGWLLVDDAHGVGVCGEQGRGSCWQQGVQPELLIVTFGKAFGVSGAALLCSDATAEYLLQFARHLIYSTAMPPAQACAIQAALGCVQQGDDLRQRLAANITRFRQGARGLRGQLASSDSAIQPLIVGDEQKVLGLARRLRDRRCWVTAIRPPTVPPGTSRLRITLSAAHRENDIDHLLEALHATDGE
ncbi:8-amino-7-oxononanoate synthase [Erwinia tasmaniensis]|uniref:8-amino-7-oxononanoate synthase n=1 Tax=Erwinia tasmaniensis (strain DSM 17950 / CFBP 7177 / CIP 109463 / NCPPB 4357 / Et1/99) TaxID=465817 RepID=BIOF_ERWT9|nr:8-amino-7-oxononanoate synthase [Erwinia tasmaniensis]B2VBT8.1 RecName: Full=8-amino-7-oxononanoate synthase; Short=AONS; AltName: Full=7-keto-8-amino-pelargonic acid synthase; Short=7-KAP synthase; Short=KAPA synthase; AltName: Full=8-amino-7-ketopelargonate synthase [Erwinia tasmaniensis Et1/99]CAO97311.1 7-keto-8-amino pelargonic acid synthetase (8-amino-7-oxononanoate synthase) [Erwinia tasmaniensis Et1/99]